MDWSKLTSKAYDKVYYDEHRKAGLDYLGYGNWQIAYARWLTDCLKWSCILDVGCACGSIANGFYENGVNAVGIDINQHMIKLGREAWPNLMLHVCDATNLHLFDDESFDGIHCAQVAEHWKPRLVPYILEELHRVSKENAVFFCCMDTEELYQRQNRKPETEDPTHYCIKPLEWWHNILQVTGWSVETGKYIEVLKNHRLSYLKHYDWDYVVCRKLS